jgi:hypothetical protein
MSNLHLLIDRRIMDLSGAEFKLAVYLYRRLERRPEVVTTVDQLAKATGLSWRQTQTALRSLNKKAILRVDGRRRSGTHAASLPD